MSERRVILTADDFGLEERVSAGIAELAAAGKLSAVSALVTLPGWPRALRLIPELRQKVALGLHLNLTAGLALGPLGTHAKNGELPPIRYWIERSLRGGIDEFAVAMEVERQIKRFEAIAGAPPDFIDGHHHVHILPGIRHALAATLGRQFPSGGILVRNPSDRVGRIVSRRSQVSKALFVTWLSRGFAALMKSVGAVTNRGFSGFSSFDKSRPYAHEFSSAFIALGEFHIAMCHPGRAGGAGDDGLRREEEFCTIASAALETRIVRPVEFRLTDGRIAWKSLARA